MDKACNENNEHETPGHSFDKDISGQMRSRKAKRNVAKDHGKKTLMVPGNRKVMVLDV